MKPFKGVTGPKFLLGAILKERHKVIEEFQFCPGRKFRADFFIERLNLLVEYEGIAAGADNGRAYTGASRHTSITGYSKDCEKYNIAQLLGFRLLRCTALNYMQARADLRRLEDDLKIGGTK